jgi:hypothetical protein
MENIKKALREAFHAGNSYASMPEDDWRTDDWRTCENDFEKWYVERQEEFKNLALPQVITPFWLWLVREANIEVIDAENAIEVRGFLKEGDMLVPVMTFAELLELYRSQNGL